MLVDGIESLSNGGENELFNLFYEKVDLFPKYLRFLFAMRQDMSVLAGKSAVHRITVDPKDPNIFDDIKEFVSKALMPIYPEAADIGSEVAKAAHGSFLYATVVKGGLRSGIIDPKDVGVLPGKIADMYFKWFKQTVSTEEYADKFYSAFSLIVALENPPLALMKKALNWRQPQLLSFLERFSTVLIKNIDRIGNLCVSFYNDSLPNGSETRSSQPDISCVKRMGTILRQSIYGKYTRLMNSRTMTASILSVSSKRAVKNVFLNN